MNNNNKLAHADKKSQALKLRADGATYDEIARVLGFANRSAAYKLVSKSLKEVVSDDVNLLRLEEGYMLDYLHRVLWAQLHDKKTGKLNLRVIDRLLAIHDRRCKLFGLYPKPGENTMLPTVIIREVPAGLLEGI